MKSTATRRAFAVLVVAACATASLPSIAAVTLLGTIATQPRVPARLTACNVAVDSGSFVPVVSFAAQANPVARYTVMLAFFDRKNAGVGHVEITDHGSDSYPLPSGADSMTCAISRLTLDDGSTYPASAGGSANAGALALGVVGVGALVGIALASHHGSQATGQTAAPTPAPSVPGGGASPTAVATSSATATSTATATASSTASASGSAMPTGPASATPSPFPTGSPTAAPTLRPQRVGPHTGAQF